MTPTLPKKDPTTTCNARTRGKKHCSLKAGWGTGHVGEGRCKLHGGKAPQVENAIARRLEEAADTGTRAVKRILENMLARVERGEEVDARSLDRLVRTVLDRSGHGPTERRELTGKDGGPVKVFEVLDDWPKGTEDDSDD